MLLYDSGNVASKESRALDAVAGYVPYCPSFQRLTETTSPEQAARFVTSGPVDDPIDEDAWTKEELADAFVICIVDSSSEEGHVVSRDNASITACPVPTGQGTLYLRRYVRDIEVAENFTRDIYRYFRDLVGGIVVEIMELAQQNNDVWLEIAVREFGPVFADLGSEVGQGQYIWCSYRFDWGKEVST